MRRFPLFLFTIALGMFFGSMHLAAQSRSNCPSIFSEPKLITDCVGGLFTQDPVHLSTTSMPPGNGFSLGLVAHKKHDYVRLSAPPGKNRLGMIDGKLGLFGSTNLSWVATGSLRWRPAIYTSDRRLRKSCNQLGFLCTSAVLETHFEGTHQQLKTVSFYGLGPRSLPTKHTFPLNNTFGNADARLPLLDWLASNAGIQILQPVLPSTSDPLAVANTFTNAQAPGLHAEPTYVHWNGGLAFSPVLTSEPKTSDSDENRAGPLMKRSIVFTFNNDIRYHQYAAVNNSTYSFQQVIADGDQSIQLGSTVRREVLASDTNKPAFLGLLRRACGDAYPTEGLTDAVLLHVRKPCNYGKLDLRTYLVASWTGAGSTVPFYLRPTVGGSDFNLRPTLRGYPDYRFRDTDAVFAQAEYNVPIKDPFGLVLFYDAGTVGPDFSSLSFAHLRQDAGFGGTLRIQGNVIGQAYVAWGAGHGGRLGYNLSKLF